MATQIETKPSEVTLDAFIASYTLIEIKDDLEKNKVKDIIRKKQALYKSTIINLSSSWETFFDVALEIAVDKIVKESKTCEKIPTNVLLRISDKLINLKDKREIWKIADSKWKNEFRNNYILLKEKFNTPRFKQIDEFVYQTMGLKDLSSNWKWKNHSVDSCRQRLDKFMDLRGNVTHRIFSSEKVNQHNILNYTDFLYRLSCISGNIIRNHVHSIIKIYPWDFEKPIKLF